MVFVIVFLYISAFVFVFVLNDKYTFKHSCLVCVDGHRWRPLVSHQTNSSVWPQFVIVFVSVSVFVFAFVFVWSTPSNIHTRSVWTAVGGLWSLIKRTSLFGLNPWFVRQLHTSKLQFKFRVVLKSKTCYPLKSIGGCYGYFAISLSGPLSICQFHSRF